MVYQNITLLLIHISNSTQCISACSFAYNLSLYPQHEAINSQCNEQANAGLKRIKDQLSSIPNYRPQLELWVTSLSDTPCLQYYDVQTLEYRYISHSRVIGLDMTENRIFTLCRMITWVVFLRMFWNFISSFWNGKSENRQKWKGSSSLHR
jgi:hypothetical protein